jgi:hypothetical protein
MFEPTLLLTKNYKTSRSAHDILEKIMKRNCERIMTIDYGLKMSPETVLKIADTEKWVLQPELKAIKEGLTYTEIEDTFYIFEDEKCMYRGYLN